jgi:hypothetical protein
LLDPVIRKAIKLARGGSRFRKSTSALRIRWKPATQGRLVKWLRGGAKFDMLAALLKEEPWLIWHPLVHFQVIRLSGFPLTEDEAWKASLLDSSHDGSDFGVSAALRRLAILASSPGA